MLPFNRARAANDISMGHLAEAALNITSLKGRKLVVDVEFYKMQRDKRIGDMRCRKAVGQPGEVWLHSVAA
jgi:hypothetical protein